MYSCMYDLLYSHLLLWIHVVSETCIQTASVKPKHPTWIRLVSARDLQSETMLWRYELSKLGDK